MKKDKLLLQGEKEMTQRNRKWIHTIAILLGMTIMCSQTSYAGFSGHNTKGDFGLQSGSQLPPGWYLVAPMYYRYNGDSIKKRDGEDFSIDSQGRGSLDVNAYVLGLIWVSEYK